MTENGSYVTRAELNAHLGPLRDDLHDIKTDVKKLLAAQAGGQTVSSWNRFLVGTVIAFAGLAVAAISVLAH